MLPFLLMAASTAFSTASSISAANSEADTQRRNARLMDQQAKDSLRRAEDNVKLLYRQSERLKSEQVESYAASGVDVGTGSPLLKMRETASLIAEEVGRVRKEARIDAKFIRAGADQRPRAANDSQSAGLVSALGGGLSLASTYYQTLGDRNTKGDN